MVDQSPIVPVFIFCFRAAPANFYHQLWLFEAVSVKTPTNPGNETRHCNRTELGLDASKYLVKCFFLAFLCVFMFWCKWKEDSGGVSRQQKAISRPTYHTLAYLATTEYHLMQYNIHKKATMFVKYPSPHIAFSHILQQLKQLKY